MTLVTREQFVESKYENHVDVEAPELGGTIRLASMTARERSTLEKQFMGQGEAMKDPGGFRVALLVRTIVDDAGELLFTDDDRDMLLSKNAKKLEVLFEAACELNGFTDKDVEDLEKN
jgi:hypothetical protein